eukprot:2280978-Alexandrium_andersonii.AAC.1
MARWPPRRQVLDPKWFGTPQTRPRLYICGARIAFADHLRPVMPLAREALSLGQVLRRRDANHDSSRLPAGP